MGERIDEYELLHPLGEGASASVWAARGPNGNVAIKKLHASTKLGEEQRRRLEREARALNRIEHACVVNVLDFGVHNDTAYLVMELLEGATLAAVLHEAVPPNEGLNLARKVIEGLAAVHRSGVVHRDVKPENVLVTFGGVKLIDFGLVKFLDAAQWGQHSVITAANVQLGTPAYMAPEVCFGEPADFPSDVYSAGILLYECLTGHLPFVGESRVSWVRHHATTPPPPLHTKRAEVQSPELNDVVQKALAKEASDRYADATELAAALSAL